MKGEKKHLKREKNILYTGFGDKGTTTLFDCNQQRISKSSNIIEALGAIDELNAYLGIVKVYAEEEKLKLKIGNLSANKAGKNILYSDLIGEIQQTLFVIQAEIAGSKMTVAKKDLNKIEKIINTIGDILPPIKTFTVSGGSILSAELDYVRTLTRRAERCVISVAEETKPSKAGLDASKEAFGGNCCVGKTTISYLNRLSSALFAMSRYANFLLSIPEDHPNYNK